MKSKIHFSIIILTNDVGACMEMHLDRIIGAALIIVGLYLVLYGKSEERKFAAEEAAIMGSGSDHVNRAAPKSSLVQPLLPPSSSENTV